MRVWGGDAVLVLPADLPFVTKDDIGRIAEMGMFGTKVVLATDRESDGTHAFLVRPAGLISYTYGKGSFERHVIAAKLADAEVKVYASPTIELDIDMPEDLAEYNRRLEEQEIELLSPFLPDLTA